MLQVWVDGKKVHERDAFLTGPLWHEVARFPVVDPLRVRQGPASLGIRPADHSPSPVDTVGQVRMAFSPTNTSESPLSAGECRVT